MRNRHNSAILSATIVVATLGATCQAPPAADPPATPQPSATPTGRPEDAARRLNVGIAYLEQHRFGQAEQSFREALALRDDYVEARVDLAIALAGAVKYDEAAKELDRVLAADPKQIHALYLSGLLAKYQGDKDRAGRRFEEVLALDANDTDTIYNLATVYKDRREFDKAIPLLERVVASTPHFLSAHYALGQAYLRQGNEAKGKEFIERFQALSGGAGGGGETAGLRYGEQGRYSLAVEDQSCRLSDDAPAVRFESAAEDFGLDFTHDGKVSPELGSGAVVFDLDGDGDDDVLLLGAAGTPSLRWFRNDGGKLVESTGAIGLGAVTKPTVGAVAGDLDNDGRSDLVVAGRLFYAGADGLLSDVTASSGVAPGTLAAAASIALVDLDHDGDLEIAAATPKSGGVTLWRNDGRGRFEVIDLPAFAGKGKVVSLLFSDLDLDRDIDALLPVEDAAPRLLSNQRGLVFKDIAADSGLTDAARARGIATADLDGDMWPDLVLTNASAEHLVLRNGRDGRFSIAQRIPQVSGPASALVTLDADLDGDLDVFLAETRGLRYFVNRGDRLDEQTEAAGLSTLAGDIRGLAAGDLDGDGDVDLVANVLGGKAMVLRNRGAEGRSRLQLTLRGLSSNKSGFGTKIDVRAGCVHQKLETRGGDGFLSQSSATLTVGLRAETNVERMRLLWPLGVLQAEIDVKAGQPQRVEELDRKGSSCPFLWAWDGEKIAFISDIQGGSPLGLTLAPGLHNLPDAEEWFLLPGGAASPRDGAYDLRISESLEEVAYLDRAMLRVIDAAADVVVMPNERLLLMPPFAPYELYFPRAVRSPISARDSDGNDVIAALTSVDRQYAGAIRRERFRGFAEPWHLELEFERPEVQPEDDLVLIAHGWIEFSNSTPMLAAGHAGLRLSPPALDVLDAAGSVVSTIADAGAPAGLPKWMVLKLPREALPPGPIRVRYRTNLEVHFDYVALGVSDPRTPHHVVDIEAETAELSFAGYPTLWSPDGRRPQIYRYDDLQPSETWQTQEGLYTRYGDVRELVRMGDDLPVVMVHGDELRLRFPTATLPALAAGQRRHLILHTIGYAKDLDTNSAAPRFVGPLPYRAMASYPYPGQGPLADAAFHARLLSWSTRYVRPSAATLR